MRRVWGGEIVGIFSIAHASGQVRKRAGGVSPPLENQHASHPNGELFSDEILKMHLKSPKTDTTFTIPTNEITKTSNTMGATDIEERKMTTFTSGNIDKSRTTSR